MSKVGPKSRNQNHTITVQKSEPEPELFISRNRNRNYFFTVPQPLQGGSAGGGGGGGQQRCGRRQRVLLQAVPEEQVHGVQRGEQGRRVDRPAGGAHHCAPRTAEGKARGVGTEFSRKKGGNGFLSIPKLVPLH